MASPQRPDIAHQQRSTASGNNPPRKIKYSDAAGDSGPTNHLVRMALRRNLRPSGVCQWMSLQEYKNVSLVTSELIIRDNDGEPSYILTIRGSIKRDDNSYFALNSLQVHPGASKVLHSGLNIGSKASLPLNCSASMKDGKGLLSQRSDIPFEEKITLLAECGYLVLRLQINGLYFSLKSISFYRNLDAVSQDPLQNRRSRQPSRAIPPMQSENLVFSNEGTQNYPLFVMPITSGYSCQNRIVLMGKNSVQLELSRFELRRLEYPTSTVARCPPMVGPAAPLTFLMDPMVIKQNYDTLNQAVADKWISKPSSSASNWANLKGRFIILSYIVSIYVARYLLDSLK